MLNGSTEPSIYKLSSRAPRFIFTQLWDIFIVWIQTLPIYPANNMRRASSRILIAAFRSRSIRFPHLQRYTLSESFSSFFTLPHLQHFLLEGKNFFQKIYILLIIMPYVSQPSFICFCIICAVALPQKHITCSFLLSLVVS